MEQKKILLKAETLVNASVEDVWKKWTEPHYIEKWYFASDDWHCPHAENNFKVGDKFSFRMEAKDGSFGFDYLGVYTDIIDNDLIAYVLGDGRKVSIKFIADKNNTKIIEFFEAESSNSIENQQLGWQSILGNFKKLVENS